MRDAIFYFDFISNNAYLAWTQLERLTSRYDLRIKPVPVLFAGLLNANNNVGPAEIVAKRQWMLKNILRKASLLGVPMRPPLHHPFNPLPALRACAAPMTDQQRWSLIDTIFKAVWVEQKHVSDLEELSKIIESARLDTSVLSEWLASPPAAEALKKNTQAAVELGAFGIPTIVIDDELFFGYDDFEFIELYLQGKDPITPDVVREWDGDKVSPSAERKR